MRILVIGASQGTGALSVQAALERGHIVTAFTRHPQRLELEHRNLTKVEGDFHQQASVEKAMSGNDAVIVTASATRIKDFRAKPTYFSMGTGHVINAMKKHGIRRLVILSAIGVGESRRLANFIVDKLVISFLLRIPFKDHGVQERLVRQSGLEWVIARASRLTNGPARNRYVIKTSIEPVPGSISRADVADFLVKACEVDTWVSKAVQIGG